MAAVNFELRSYQREALSSLRTYLRKVGDLGARTAFIDQTNRPYHAAPFVDPETPYVCVRIPTGGGKTIVAAHAVGAGAREHLQTDAPMVLWLVPSSAILDQTLAALRNLEHPYRAALAQDFGRNVSVLSIDEALTLSRADASGGACIIVATLQAFRVDDTAGRKVYQDAGALMDHFSGLNEDQRARLELMEGTHRPVASLANVLRLHRPMVIVDEAHNARTALSFETLRRFDPSMILELTATPRTEPDKKTGDPASNVLFHVSAAELKAEEMIKLPIRLQTDTDWRKVVGQALDCREALEREAEGEAAETGEYIRPIILFQAQSKSKTDPDRLTPEAVCEFLTEDKRIPREQIAIHATGHAELDAIEDISDPACPVRYVITVQKLREGWDCPFAYVLCSVAELSSKVAVEQILGRVLRMPKARRKTRDTLNRAYAFVTSRDFNDTATMLKDGLVEGAGFDRLEAAELVKAHQGLGFEEDQAEYVHQSDALPEAESVTPETVTEALGKLPASLKARVSFDPQTRKFGVRRALSRDDRNHMHLALAEIPGAEKVVEGLFIKSNRIQASEQGDTERPPFIVPRLGVYRQGELELFGEDHFLDLPWRLDECSPAGLVKRFTIQDGTKTGELDIGEQGRMEVSFVGHLHDQLSMAIHEPAWTPPRLVNWIDRGISHPDVTKPAARIFIQGALEAVMAEKGYSLDQLARYKYELRREVSAEINALRKERETGQYAALFSADAEAFETSAELGLIFDEQSYAYNQPYKGGRKFEKHYFPIIGDLKPDGEEFKCAVHLEEHKRVRFWVRNVDRKPNAFWLQLPSGRFYPDFVAMLDDGRIAVVEYKGAHLAEEAAQKRKIGELWAEASEGQCVFAMPTGRDFAEIDRAIEAGA
ncbi:MAG: DEAD/DEAH box helicase [Oceanicaulis sp.]